jgi:hypothetical protein
MANGPYGPIGPRNAGDGALPRMPQQLRRQYGLPFQPLPGMFNGAEAARARKPVIGPTPQAPAIDPGIQCILDYLVARMCACIPETLLNIPLNARRPSHIDIPFAARCLDLHTGTGPAGSTDPPITLPAVGAGGAFSTVVTFECPAGSRAEITGWGVAMAPVVQAPFVEWRIRVAGVVATPFDGFHGSGGFPAQTGTWFGPPFTLADPAPLCTHLQRGQGIILEARNTNAPGPITVDVAGRLVGWEYQATIQTDQNDIRSTLVDQR